MTQSQDLIAEASITVNAPVAAVWNALVDPGTIERYMFGATVRSDWRVGSPITWTGEWQGKPYEDKGTIRRIERDRALEYTHFSPLTGLADIPENYHTVRIELSEKGAQTTVSLTQDNNPTEQAREHSEKNWGLMLASLKKVVEG
jgi:uncharacterized protein YndB with AHSA1/START domain